MRLEPIGWLFGCSSFAVVGVPDDVGDLVANKIGGGIVGGVVEQEMLL